SRRRGPRGRRWWSAWFITSLLELEEVEGQRHGLDDVLVGLVVPIAGDELHRPRAVERPAAQRRAVAVLLDDVEVALELGLVEARVRRGVRDLHEPVEEVAIRSGPALERHVGERQPTGALVRDERA